MKNFQLALVANIASIHTLRWANALSERNYDVHLITQDRGGDKLSGRVEVHFLPFQGNKGYFINALFLRKLLKQIKPDLLHAHYASGYGTLGRLSGFHPYMLSVWGADVYDFPYESFLKMKLLKLNLQAADVIASTSHVMAKQTHKICENLPKIHVTPFGIDIQSFKPLESVKHTDVITIGTVKTLAYKYGIDTLIQGFAETRDFLMATDKHMASKLRLLIVGGGPDRASMEQLAKSLNISDVAEFTGAVPYGKVPEYLNRLDIYVAASRLDSESFGVAILEASACALPVIVTNVGGLPEVVEDGVTGIIIPKDDHHALAKAIEKLLLNQELRDTMGRAGLKRVIDYYNWEDSVTIMENIYKNAVKTGKN